MTTRIIQLIILFCVTFLAGCSDDRPDPPVLVAFRRSAIDPSGLVMQVRNTSQKNLSCKMTARNVTTNETRTHLFNVGPGATEEIGILEASWTFMTGETVRIDTEGHKTFVWTVP